MQATAESIVDRIRQALPAPGEKTVDVFHTHHRAVAVSTVVVTMQATRRVLEEAVRLGAQLIITHEPTFYVDGDRLDLPAYAAARAEKQAYTDAHRLSIWRCHDAWHRRRPDGIAEGFALHMGWAAHAIGDELRLFDLPEVTLGRLAAELAGRVGADQVRVVGDLSRPVRRVGVSSGCPGWQVHIELLGSPGIDVLVCGEAREWETYELVRDAQARGGGPALVVLGHVASEEPGMRHFARWLQDLSPELDVHYVASSSPYAHVAAGSVSG